MGINYEITPWPSKDGRYRLALVVPWDAVRDALGRTFFDGLADSTEVLARVAQAGAPAWATMPDIEPIHSPRGLALVGPPLLAAVSPLPWSVRDARSRAQLTEAQAAGIVGVTMSEWRQWESKNADAEEGCMPVAAWHLFLLRTHVIPSLSSGELLEAAKSLKPRQDG